MCVFLYADDIQLIAPSGSALQILSSACDEELTRLGMQLNEKKSVCMRFGSRFNADCENLRLAHGGLLQWSSQCRCLGMYCVSGRAFRCSFDQCKCRYYKSFNAVFSKVGRLESEEVVLDLTRNKCLPVFLYGVEACPTLVRDKRSLEFTVTRSLMKIFQTGSVTVVSDCMNVFYFLPVSHQIDIRTARFLENFMCSENYNCTSLESKADSNLNEIFSVRCNTMSLKFSSSCEVSLSLCAFCVSFS